MTRIPCFGIAGWKNSGKTSLVAGLVAEISSRGFSVSTIKHAHHDFDLDQSGTDSFAHRKAGAKEVMLVSGKRWALQHELNDEDEPEFDEMLSTLSPCDLVIVEGYKRELIPKIEIIGSGPRQDLLWKQDNNIKAIASDKELHGCPLPMFKRRETVEISDFILNYHGLLR